MSDVCALILFSVHCMRVEIPNLKTGGKVCADAGEAEVAIGSRYWG